MIQFKTRKGKTADYRYLVSSAWIPRETVDNLVPELRKFLELYEINMDGSYTVIGERARKLWSIL